MIQAEEIGAAQAMRRFRTNPSGTLSDTGRLKTQSSERHMAPYPPVR